MTIDDPDEELDRRGESSAPIGTDEDVVLARSQAKLAELAVSHGTIRRGTGSGLRAGGRQVSYSGTVAVRDVSMSMPKNLVTAFIGPSGCGKTTLLRTLNRMNDLINGAEVSGTIRYHGHDLNASGIDAVEVRRRIGMVFQRPNPFPKSIFDNVAFGLRLHGMTDHLNDRVEKALTPRRAVGRGQGPAEDQRAGPVRRPAAAAVHRPRAGHRAGRDPDGRAGLGARPDRHPADRGSDRAAEVRVHDRDRHPQHAAGGAGGRHDGLLQRGRAPRAASAAASWSSTAPRPISSPSRPTSALRRTSPAASAESRNQRAWD